MKAGLVLILAGVFVGAQILKGGALDRILSGSSSSSGSLPNPTLNPPGRPPAPAGSPGYTGPYGLGNGLNLSPLS